MSVAALVLGILSLIFGGALGIVIGVVSLSLAGIALKRNIGKRGLAIAGLACGIVGTAWNVIYTLVVIIQSL